MKNSNIRIQAKNLFLTYSQIDKNLTREDFLNFFLGVKKIKLKKYIISFEKHKDGNPHCHILLNLKEKPNIRGMRYFDLNYNNKVFHPNIQIVKFNDKVNYTIKEDKEYLSNLDIEKLKENINKKRSYDSLIAHLITILQKEGIDNALNYFYKNSDNKTLADYSTKIIRTLNSINSLKIKNENTKGNFNLSTFKRVKSLENHVEKYKKGELIRTLFWAGKSRIGKTELMLKFLEENKIKYVYGRSPEMFKDKDLTGAWLILDDANLSKIKDREVLMNIFETIQPHYLPARFSNILVPAKTPKVIISNYTFDEFLKEVNLENDISFIERTDATFIEEKIYINNENSNIQINVINNFGSNNNIIQNPNQTFVKETIYKPSKK